MTRTFRVQPILTEAETLRIIGALRASQDHALANRLVVDHANAKRVHDAQLASEQSLREYRAQRAADHALTKRQAECLAAVRAGQGPFDVPWSFQDAGVTQWRWRRSRNMGGAVRRMVETLIEEGLLTERRQLTDGGRERLAGYEAVHGPVAGGVA